MHTIAIIGGGQMGSRHLQGLATINASIHLVDPSDASLELSRSRFAETVIKSNVGNFETHHSIDTLPRQIDLAIIATTAKHRFMAMTALCEHAVPRYLVLEKVLFERFSDYDAAQKLLDRHGITAWVNCPRRVFQFYRELQKSFEKDPLRAIRVYGGEWGLGSSAVHFADLFTFLSGSIIQSYDSDYLDTDSIPSKRPGAVERTGTLRGRVGSSTIELTAVRGSNMPPIITIESSASHLTIDETADMAWSWTDRSGWKAVALNNLYQSEMSGRLAEQMLSTGHCELTPFRESVDIHLPILKAFVSSGGGGQTEICPVT